MIAHSQASVLRLICTFLQLGSSFQNVYFESLLNSSLGITGTNV